ncbi:cytochrome P450 [Podospora australis]|uniref:Cytochrome P450 n=1 Tax=Podospora australis TaxID=1536484 RepID=A0AAN6WTA1_9PEZI|nr:cytochrome P450 [Podospora australis]
MEEEAQDRGVMDVFKWFLFMATDIIGKLSFGESSRTLETGEHGRYPSNHSSLVILANRFTLAARLSPAFSAVPKSRRYARESIARHERLALFSNVFKAKNEERMTPEEVFPEAESYIIAGTGTTSNTLTYLVWSVCSHPKIQEELVRELRSLPQDFGDAELKELPYLALVIEETLRLYSAVPSGLPRIVPPGGAELAGHRLDEGVTVCAQAYSMHNNPDVFPDPLSFKPERWAEPVPKVMRDSFMPWGRGARLCIGMHLAKMELRLSTAKFFLTFPDAKVSTQEGMSDKDMMPPDVYFLMRPPGKRCLIETRSV